MAKGGIGAPKVVAPGAEGVVLMPLTCPSCGLDLVFLGVAGDTTGLFRKLVFRCAKPNPCGTLMHTTTLRWLRDAELAAVQAALTSQGPSR